MGFKSSGANFHLKNKIKITNCYSKCIDINEKEKLIEIYTFFFNKYSNLTKFCVQ